ncbi:hypothetical protein BGZ60DRAFT_381858 [Tricladium varicosporioides]|nr:hypothetical protein BGZ60DRAFT_381858 [Hymenoscyphus varicosporioides]
MATSQPYIAFTITQAQPGSPLQFVPALGSQELEQLIDAYISGDAPAQDKMAAVTLDFFNNASVDISTGMRVRTYEVFPLVWANQPFELSPVESQSSGVSPLFYTPSPASSTALGDSGYNSIGMTPPNRTKTGRVSKKTTKKETKKVAETRLPGFSIMTKDGVDVTSTAGRGTKTKEQREHAHLMRIMKACDACKRKKIRVGPSCQRRRMNANEK